MDNLLGLFLLLVGFTFGYVIGALSVSVAIGRQIDDIAETLEEKPKRDNADWWKEGKDPYE